MSHPAIILRPIVRGNRAMGLSGGDWWATRELFLLVIALQNIGLYLTYKYFSLLLYE